MAIGVRSMVASRDVQVRDRCRVTVRGGSHALGPSPEQPNLSLLPTAHLIPLFTNLHLSRIPLRTRLARRERQTTLETMASNPPTEDYSPITTRPHSIDLTLELEHQLNAESLPNSPSPNVGSFERQSLDPHVLATIITQLRISLEKVTRERDDLLSASDEAAQKQALLQENLQLVTDRSTKLEEQLSAAHDKHRDDEEAISMLRTKVEESRSVHLYVKALRGIINGRLRRGLMRLQTESRRMSQLTVDSSARVNGSPSPNKRMSLLINPPPNPNRGHRRISSQSDSGFMLPEALNWSSPPPSSSALTDEEQNFTSKEVQNLKQEIKSLNETLEETKHELSEANEAREASEQCAKALRDYISEFRVGEAGSSPSNIPPPPNTPSKAEDPKVSSKWSFKLWNGGNSTTSPSISPATPLSPPTSSSVLSPVSSPQPPALTRKLGSFFSSRAGSISSATSITTQQPSICRASSDVSSLTEEEEPNSPCSDGSRAPAQIVIRQFTTGLSGSDVDGGESFERGKQSGDFASTPTQNFPIAL